MVTRKLAHARTIVTIANTTLPVFIANCVCPATSEIRSGLMTPMHIVTEVPLGSFDHWDIIQFGVLSKNTFRRP